MKPLIIANWKMNPQTLAEANQLFNSVVKGIRKIKNACPVGSRRLSFGVEVVICPPFIYIPTFRHSNIPTIKLGAQDCFWEKRGAFTGEISSVMLRNLGCQYVIIGHSERRRYLGETDEMINKKIKAAIEAKLKPILCIGETEKERKGGKTFDVLKNQTRKALNNISNFEFRISNFIIAYEPVWAIGTGKACGIEEAQKVNSFIKKLLKHSLLLYGGSVNSQNAKDYIKGAGFQGLLVGGASLNPKEFVKIVKSVED